MYISSGIHGYTTTYYTDIYVHSINHITCSEFSAISGRVSMNTLVAHHYCRYAHNQYIMLCTNVWLLTCPASIHEYTTCNYADMHTLNKSQTHGC